MLALPPMLFSLLLAQPVPGWSVAFDPATAGAVGVQWTITVSAPYCGGYRIGDGVYIAPETPLALPDAVPGAGVLLDGHVANVAIRDGVLRVTVPPGQVQPMICQGGERHLTVALLPALGLTNPEAGTYAVDVWVGSGSVPARLPVTIADAPLPPATVDGGGEDE